MKLVTKLGLGLVMVSGIANAGAYTKDADAFGALHPAGLVVQIATDNIALAYYADRHDYTIGAEISPYVDSSVAGVKTNGMTLTAFARKNMPLTTNVVFGYGLSTSTAFGKVNDASLSNVYSVGAYGSIEYAATKNVYLSASITPVKYTTSEVSSMTTKTWTYLRGGSFQLGYRFQ